MTRSEWRTTADVLAMIDTQLLLEDGRKVPTPSGRLTLTDRKWRLFACACVRSIWSDPSQPDAHLIHDDSRAAVDTAEMYADGLASAQGLSEARFLADRMRVKDSARSVRHAARCCDPVGFKTCRSPGEWDRSGPAVASILRDIAGDPFAPFEAVPSWRTPDVLMLAGLAYVDRLTDGSGELDKLRLTILADALMDAGCGDDSILDHLCSPGLTHHRGCWVIDALLGKE